MPEEVSNAMLGKATEQSAVLSLFRRVPVGRAQVRFPVLSALPVAYWVSGDTGLKQTTEINWSNKYLNIEEIATIMPVPDNVIADVDMNVWDTAMPLLAEAAARVLDSAVFFGTNAPAASRRTSTRPSPRRATTPPKAPRPAPAATSATSTCSTARSRPTATTRPAGSPPTAPRRSCAPPGTRRAASSTWAAPTAP
jgi:hypothetical protein